MLERTLEKYLVAKCKERGIYERKFVSPQCRNVPDRILINHGVVVFVELKAPGKRPTPAQSREHTRLVNAGGLVIVADSKEEIDHLIENLIL